ncbi:UNVERIFIED_CONTAM: hypothetical protein Slati_4413100 [Sesamum latifolium]|uniref:Uncharacterized protein n=1 Tax=Sesamum latifolium TaxID=2727402 RepID=A0AAW2SPT6_9LAMI
MGHDAIPCGEKLEDLKAGLNNDTERLRPPKQKARVPDTGEGGKKGKGTAITATASTGGAPPYCPKGKGKRKRSGVLSSRRQMMCAFIAMERDTWKRECPTTPLHPGIGAGFKDIKEVGRHKKVLEIDNLDHLPTCESYLKGKMTKKPFVGQSAIAKGLLDLVHIDVCGPLSIPARGGFSYFITITDHSRYGYVLPDEVQV